MIKSLIKTDWDRYYTEPFFLTKITRRLTSSRILNAIRGTGHGNGPIHICELGGANSCCFPMLNKKLDISTYAILDNNKKGLEISNAAFSSHKNIEIFDTNILTDNLGCKIYDLTISCGLIEHFNHCERRLIIKKHVDITKYGGHIIISFPIPTISYKLIRGFSETFGLWAFPDEMPLESDSVANDLIETGSVEILRKIMIWEIGLTQCLIVARKIKNKIYL